LACGRHAALAACARSERASRARVKEEACGVGCGRAGQAEARRGRGCAREELGCFGQWAESEVAAR
jgi:hypothetical protein